MQKGKIGVQTFPLAQMVGQIGVYETFKKVSEVGFHCIEPSMIPMTPENVADMKRACEDFDIKIAALSADLEPMVPGQPGSFLTTDFDKYVSDCKTLDCKYLRIGMMPPMFMTSLELAMQFIQRCEDMAKRLNEHGIALYYHNHHVEFVKYDGKYLLDIIRDNTEYLGFELDVHWIQRGGENPVSFIKGYKGRLKLLHLKDYRIGTLKMPENPSDIQAFFAAFNEVVQFAEVGEGSLPMKEIIETGLECGSEYFIVEQDMPYEREVFECMKISKENLEKMGFGDWF